jgi:ribosomal protein S18 acetylase RimI-like enzyme
MPPTFEILAGHHERAGFNCGEPSLNGFLQRQARQNASRNLGVTHVAVATAGDARILGYYTLLTRTVERDLLPRPGQFPRDGIGVVLLGRLAVDESAQGQRIGTTMLLRAIKQTEAAARNIGIHALVVNALNERARAWYQGFDFETLQDDPNHLYLSIATIRELGLAEE